MNHLRSAGVAILFPTLCSSDGPPAVADVPLKPKSLVAVVWETLGASGAKEVVIEPDIGKLGAWLDVRTTGQSRKVEAIRLGQWSIKIDKKEFDLTTVAKLTVRGLQSPPFTVKLRDGREVLITPSPRRIGHYVVTGEYFEQDVRGALADFSGKDPGKVQVLGMIPVPGTVIPHFTEKDSMRHFSAGEPLETFAAVKVRDKPMAPALGPPSPPDR